jgi:hypothetical protein
MCVVPLMLNSLDDMTERQSRLDASACVRVSKYLAVRCCWRLLFVERLCECVHTVLRGSGNSQRDALPQSKK